jgi:adenosylcobinamide amidohydrolase
MVTTTVRMVEHDAMLLFDVPAGWVGLSSAAVGGGLVWPRVVVNLSVGEEFLRTDLDAYVHERLAPLGLVEGPVSALLTAADVRCWTGGESDGVRVWATVAPTKPTWAARPGGLAERPGQASQAPAPGTVNIVAALPVALTTSALVQAVGTVTEAKAQALLHAGVPGTGTASDALVVLCPDSGSEGEEPVPFAGVRSPWGHRLAEAVRQAVSTGMQVNPWPHVAADPDRLW